MPLSLLPIFINKNAGNAQKVIESLMPSTTFTVHVLEPEELNDAIQKAVDKGFPRIIIVGGDGTLALAANILRDSHTEMAIIPGGTHNHFSKHLNIPLDIDNALQLALTGQSQPTSYGTLNDQLFLNTSSVGAYNPFVQSRDKNKRLLPHLLTHYVSAFRRLISFKRLKVRFNDTQRLTPMVFIGVGERQLKLPELGQNLVGGKAGLHLIVLDCHSRFAALSVAIQAMFRGVNPLKREHQLNSAIVELVEVKVRTRKKWLTVALDGELFKHQSPLRYQFYQRGLQVVMPMEKDTDK